MDAGEGCEADWPEPIRIQSRTVRNADLMPGFGSVVDIVTDGTLDDCVITIGNAVSAVQSRSSPGVAAHREVGSRKRKPDAYRGVGQQMV
jgi:hypothetical protein